MNDDNMNNTIMTNEYITTSLRTDVLADDKSTFTVTTPSTPKANKGGVFATADAALIKAALSMYAEQDISEAEERQIVNLMHRLNNRI